MSVRKVFWSCSESHSSKASMMTNLFSGRRPDSALRNDSKIFRKNRLNWTLMDLKWIERSAFSADSRYGHILGMDVANCHASVRNSRSKTPRSDVFLWKKKDAARCVSWQCSAMV